MDRKTTSNQKENGQKEVLCYIEADKPLTYNFFDVTTLDQLIDKEPTSGKRKVPKKKEINEEKSENKIDNKIQSNNMDEEEIKIKKLRNETNEIFEGNLRDEMQGGGGKKFQETILKVTAKEETKKDEQKKLKITYKKYTNSFNVANNKLTTIAGIYGVLMELLPELSFKSKLNKVELLQWIDISRNKLTDIHEDICRLPYLKILYVHGNNIQEIEKVVNLRKCKSLTSLSLYGNPIDHIKGYRHFIIEMCPLLEKLDSAVISEKELDIIKFRGSRYGEVRGKNGKILKYPKLPDEIIKTIQLAEQNNAEKKDDN